MFRDIINCCGSYRRGKETCGDIDLLISNPNITSKEKCKQSLKLIVNNLIYF